MNYFPDGESQAAPANALVGGTAAKIASENSGHRTYRLLLLALLLFLLQTIPFLSYRWLTDESWYAGPGLTISQGRGVNDPGIGPNDLEHRFDCRPPGTALVMAGFFRVLGVGQVQARLGSVLAGLGIVVLVFYLSRTVFGDQAAVIAAFVAATDNLIVLTARTARPEALTTMAVLLGMAALALYQRRYSLKWAFLSGLSMALGTMFHITLAGYLVSFGLLFLFGDRLTPGHRLRAALLYSGGFFLGLIPFAVWIFATPTHLGVRGFQEEYLSRSKSQPLTVKLVHELHRYSDVVGLGMVHGHGLENWPVRLPIPLFFLFATYLLWRHCRRWFYVELCLLVPSVLWLGYTVNKSSRYVALLAPIFALTIGAAVSIVRAKPRLHRLMLQLTVCLIVAQSAANFYLLNGARKANYNVLASRLRAVIPAGATTYGTITFWLALRDSPFIAYERTTPNEAANDFNARYYILGDRIMTMGNGWESDYYKDLNDQLAKLSERGDMVGEIRDPYYGDLKIYRIASPAAQ